MLHPSLAIVNVYLPVQSDALKTPILEALSKLQLGPRVLAAGDWNFTEDPEDGSHQLAGPALNAWERLKAKHSIREVAQPTATFYGAGDVFSRIDTEADQALASLEA